MDYAGDWFYNPGLHWELIHRQEEEAKAAKKEKEERERRRDERKEVRLKKKNEQQQARTENGRNKTGSRKDFDEEENAFDIFVNFVKEEILEDKPATPKYLSISEYAKSKNRQEDVKVRPTTHQPPTNMHPELTFVPTQRTARTRESSGDPSNISNTFGTRNFIPAFMGCVAFISLTMILFAVCRWFLYRTSRKRLRINNSVKKTSNPEDGNAFHGEGCKLNTFEPSAPAELELEHCIVTPGVHTSRQEGNRFEDSARVITDFRLKYQTALSAKRSGNSKSLMPLLEHVFGRGNECENCRQPFNSQRCHANFNNRM